MTNNAIDTETINSFFLALENTSAPSGLLKKRIHVSESFEAVLVLDASTKLRGVELEFLRQLQLINLPEKINGLEIRLETGIDNSQKLSLIQKRTSDNILFSTLLQDLLKSGLDSLGHESRITSNRLAKWRQFFMTAREGLSVQAQLGLFTELVTLNEILAPTIGWDSAIEHWHGPASEVHDFSSEEWAIEVKATSTKNKSAQISSEVQLDPDFVERLFLIFHSMDVRSHSSGESLPQIIKGIKKQLEASKSASALFEDKLLEVGYHDIHAYLYQAHYISTGSQIFEVSSTFPSIRKSTIPLSTSGVSYSLHIDQCGDWLTSVQELFDIITESGQQA